MLLAVSGAHFMHGFVLSLIKRLNKGTGEKNEDGRKKMRREEWRETVARRVSRESCPSKHRRENIYLFTF